MEANESTNRKSGRYRLNDEDKARPVPLKLKQSYIDKLDHLPGKTTAETIRNIIDNSIEWSERERRQAKEIQRLIKPLYKVSKNLFDPKTTENKEVFHKSLNKFREGLSSLEALIEILHFDISSLKKILTDREMVMLEIIFSVRASLKSQ